MKETDEMIERQATAYIKGDFVAISDTLHEVALSVAFVKDLAKIIDEGDYTQDQWFPLIETREED